MDEELGSGGSGAVFKAWHKRLRKYVVVKIVKIGSSGKPEVRRNEVEALKNIKNLYVPQVLDFCSENGHCFTVMEYIDGVSFDKLLRIGRRFPEEQVMKWYRQLASVLEEVHRNNVCHRDIKPANIMLMKSGDICLIDFNSAFVGGNDTGMISRSMGYASPEQYEYFKMCRDVFAGNVMQYSHYIEAILLSGDCATELVTGTPTNIAGNDAGSIRKSIDCERRYDVYNIDWKLSDIYSLGATMLHFLTGKRPPVKADDVACISNIVGISGGLLQIIGKSMKTDPAERYFSAEELSYAIWNIM